MRDELRRLALISSGVAELTRTRAEQIVKDLVKEGDIRREQASGMVRDLVERSKENRKEVAAFVRAEIRNQVESLGLASRRDVERLERRVARLEAAGATPARKTTARKTAAKKTAAKKTRARKPRASGSG